MSHSLCANNQCRKFEVTPKMIAAAWRVFNIGRPKYPDGRFVPIGPGNGFVEAIAAAFDARDTDEQPCRDYLPARVETKEGAINGL